ncbi:ssDNA endonuclease and repair protein rad10 [Mortierella sp. AD031]|nr:ssDNA endonuclease and repair protein rad10 [Mortierella sp. AD031]
MSKDNTRDTTTNKGPAAPFKLPTRTELEERRKQLEVNKPAIHFKPTGIAIIHNSPKGLDTNATNSATSSSNRSSSASHASTTSTIVSSRQHYQKQQQQQQQQKITNVAAAAAVEDDDFGFGDELGDVNFNDDLYDIDGPSSTNTAPKPPSSTTTTGPGASIPSIPSSTPAPTSNPAATTTTTTTTAAPATAPLPYTPKSKSTIVVRTSQRGNPLLQFIRNVPYEYGEVVPDFVVGLTSCVLFLSIRYHRLHPEYIFSRIASLGNNFVLRVLLVLVDVDTHQHAIRELTRVAMVNNLTLVCAWSNEEAARYIETYKAYENKAPDAIKERVENDYLSKLTDGLTQIPSINKTDIITLSSTFGSLKNIMDASADELGLLPGFGERKVKRLLEAFDQPFAIDPKKRRHRRS